MRIKFVLCLCLKFFAEMLNVLYIQNLQCSYGFMIGSNCSSNAPAKCWASLWMKALYSCRGNWVHFGTTIPTDGEKWSACWLEKMPLNISIDRFHAYQERIQNCLWFECYLHFTFVWLFRLLFGYLLKPNFRITVSFSLHKLEWFKLNPYEMVWDDRQWMPIVRT